MAEFEESLFNKMVTFKPGEWGEFLHLKTIGACQLTSFKPKSQLIIRIISQNKIITLTRNPVRTSLLVNFC